VPLVRINATAAFSAFFFNPSSLWLWDVIASACANTYFALFLNPVGNMVWIAGLNNEYLCWRIHSSKSAETTSRVCHYLG
jgi:hypothetical protein